jgi:hypothetical protein
MARIRIVRAESSPDDPTPIPPWFDNPEGVGPCPCGMPPDDDCLLIEGDVSLKRWFHKDCLDWLEQEMTPDEIKEMHEWKRRMQEGDNE